MIAKLKLQSTGPRHEKPILNDVVLEGVQRVVLTMGLHDIARADISFVLPDGIDYEGDVDAYFHNSLLAELVQEAVLNDEEWHKQWYLEQIAKALNIELPEHEAGIAP